MTSKSGYEVGYKKPPKHTQYKPGWSGNAKGRPKGSKNLKTDLIEEMSERIPISEDGKQRKVSKQRALLKTLTVKALKGDQRSASILLNLILRLFEPDAEDDANEPTPQEDLEILAAFKARVAEETKTRSQRKRSKKRSRKSVRKGGDDAKR